MAVRTLDQVLSELGSVYNPQVETIRKQQAGIPNQIKAEEQGLQAKQTQSFEEILGGARRRGMGFSGIPLGEQAKYNATEYMPALARLKQSGREQATSLEQALQGIYERRNTLAQQLRQGDIDNDYRERVFQAQQEEQRRAAARASAGSGFSPSYGGASAGGVSGGPAGAPVAPQLQTLFNQMFVRGDGSKWDDKALVSDYNRTKLSAGYGNVRDKQKIQLYHSARPDLFGNTMPGYAFGNGGGLKF